MAKLAGSGTGFEVMSLKSAAVAPFSGIKDEKKSELSGASNADVPLQVITSDAEPGVQNRIPKLSATGPSVGPLCPPVVPLKFDQGPVVGGTVMSKSLRGEVPLATSPKTIHPQPSPGVKPVTDVSMLRDMSY